MNAAGIGEWMHPVASAFRFYQMTRTQSNHDSYTLIFTSSEWRNMSTFQREWFTKEVWRLRSRIYIMSDDHEVIMECIGDRNE